MEWRNEQRAEQCRELARAWYLKGLLIRCEVLGADHPLSQRALVGFNAHADGESELLNESALSQA